MSNNTSRNWRYLSLKNNCLPNCDYVEILFFCFLPAFAGKSGHPPLTTGGGGAFTLTGTGVVMQFASGFPRITRERIGWSSRNLVCLTIEQFHTFLENFKSLPTMTFDLWPDFQGYVRPNLRSIQFQRLKLANFGIFAGDMDMNRCWKMTSMVYTDIVTFPRSIEVIRGQWHLMTSYVFFVFVLPPGVIWCADFELGMRLSFICVEIGSLGS